MFSRRGKLICPVPPLALVLSMGLFADRAVSRLCTSVETTPSMMRSKRLRVKPGALVRHCWENADRLVRYIHVFTSVPCQNVIDSLLHFLLVVPGEEDATRTRHEHRNAPAFRTAEARAPVVLADLPSAAEKCSV